jgi:PilZ domain
LPATQAEDASPIEFTGRIQNISEGGISLLSECPLEPTTFIRCSILSPDIPVPIPTLMQVRWSVVRRDHETQSYLSGLLFVA